MAEAGRSFLLRSEKGEIVNSRSNAGISRRNLLLAAAGGALIPSLRAGPARSEAPGEIRLKATPGSAALLGAAQPQTRVWAYNGVIPGPVLRLRQGEPARVVVEKTANCVGLKCKT